MSDLRYKLVLMEDGKPVNSFETTNREYRIEDLEEEINYSIKVTSIRKNSEGDKEAEFSPVSTFFIPKETKPMVRITHFLGLE